METVVQRSVARTIVVLQTLAVQNHLTVLVLLLALDALTMLAVHLAGIHAVQRHAV